jgi:PAS domain S-box-containing protein
VSASELEILRAQVATLTQLLEVHEEQASRQFAIIRAQQRDLEERTRELAKNAAFLQELYRAMPSVLLVCDANGVVVGANDATTAILEYTNAELIGLSLEQIFETGDSLVAEGFAAKPGVLRTEKTLVTKLGTRVPVLLCAAVSADEDDRKLVCVGLDIRDRRRLELELRQAQKLESIGRLAAGVAHEINTPIQFVTDSVHFLRESIPEVFGVLDQAQRAVCSVAEGAGAAAAMTALDEARASADLPYLLENIPSAIERSLDGLDRVSAIVRSMKHFAHPDSREMTSVDLNQAIESTLVIARNEYKLVADVETAFAELPPVRCYLGDLNQVVLNIVVNAAHAIADRVGESGVRGRIRVSTHHEAEDVVIAIRDTGGGIPESIRHRVFDPFFTTKEVGRGTGQGLAIARQVVVDRHRGELTFESELGVGTTFYIRIPTSGAQDARGDLERALP